MKLNIQIHIKLGTLESLPGLAIRLAFVGYGQYKVLCEWDSNVPSNAFFIWNLFHMKFRLCNFIITQIIRILDTFMFRLNVLFKTTLLCSLIITLITWILYFFYGESQYVFLDHFYEYIVCHIGNNDTLPPHEMIWYVYLNGLYW